MATFFFGNAFACRWVCCNNVSVCWVTQLVIHEDYRERGLATGLLNLLRENGDDLYGIMSSHPAACLAASKSFVHIDSSCVKLMLNALQAALI